MLSAVRLNPNVEWYVARASGLVAWGLLATTVLWGLVYAGRLTRKVPPPAWNLDLHRFLGGLSVVFVGVHVLALAADRYVEFGFTQILVPMASGWRPGSVAWGITAMYLLVAVELTSLAKRRLPKKIWRAVHLLSFVLFVFSTVHAIQSGTDLANPVVRVVGIGLITLAVAAAGLRIARTRHVVGPAPAPSTVAAVGATAERPPAMSSMR